MIDCIIKPVPDRTTTSEALERVQKYEAEAAVEFAEKVRWGDRDHEHNKVAFTFDDYFTALIVETSSDDWMNPFKGRYNRFTTVNTKAFELGDEGERIDSIALRKALVTLCNVEALNEHKTDILLNGVSGLAWNQVMVASAPLNIECLAEATRGGYIMLQRNVARLLTTILITAEYRQAHGLPGGDIKVRALVLDDGKRLILNVSTGLIRVLIEQGVEVRPYFDVKAVNHLLLHEPEVLANFNTASARRAARASAKEVNRPDLIERAIDETVAHTAVFAGTTGLSIARLNAARNQTADTREWPFKLVPNSTVQSSGKAWQVIAGAVFEVLPSVAETLTVGLTDNRSALPLPPVLFYGNDGTIVAAISTYAEART